MHLYIHTHIYILGVARYMYSYRTVTVQASLFGAWDLTTNTGNSPPIQKGAPAAMQRCLITASRRTANANGDTEVAALMFGSLYFILIKYQLAVKLAKVLLPAESTWNTYCLINNHCIKVCFYLCTLTMKTKQILYIYNVIICSIFTSRWNFFLICTTVCSK